MDKQKMMEEMGKMMESMNKMKSMMQGMDKTGMEDMEMKWNKMEEAMKEVKNEMDRM